MCTTYFPVPDQRFLVFSFKTNEGYVTFPQKNAPSNTAWSSLDSQKTLSAGSEEIIFFCLTHSVIKYPPNSSYLLAFVILTKKWLGWPCGIRLLVSPGRPCANAFQFACLKLELMQSTQGMSLARVAE